MDRDEMRTAGDNLLVQARALRAAFPDVSVMCGIAVNALPPGPGFRGLRDALRYLWDEMILMRGGGAEDVGVLDDEIAHVENLLSRV